MQKKLNTIITGASRGIGFELAKLCLKHEYNVLVISRNQDKLNRLKKYQSTSELLILPMDFEKLINQKAIQSKIQHWAYVDLLYNNAGYLVKKEFALLNKMDFLRSWQVNFLAPAQIIQAIIKKTNQESHIVNITTMGAVQGSVKFPGLAAYSASKAALSNLTELLAEEFKENGPIVNNVALGAVQTEMLAEAFPGYQAPISPQQMAQFLYHFGVEQKFFFNGKTIQCSKSTP